MSNIPIPHIVLAGLLEHMEAADRAVFCRFDRKTKTYPWNDEIWRAASPSTFALVAKAREALTAAGKR